jgi:hypothetical protein
MGIITNMNRGIIDLKDSIHQLRGSVNDLPIQMINLMGNYSAPETDWVDNTVTVITTAWNGMQAQVRRFLAGLLENEQEVNEARARSDKQRDVEVKPKLPTTAMPNVEDEIRRRRAETADAEAKTGNETVSESSEETAQNTKETAKTLTTVVRLLDVIRRLLSGGAVKGKKIGGVDIRELTNEISDLDEILSVEWASPYIESAPHGIIFK